MVGWRDMRRDYVLYLSRDVCKRRVGVDAMIREFVENGIAHMLAHMLAPTLARNIVEGIAEFERHYFRIPIRCKARRFMKRGENRIDYKALFPDVV